MKKLLLPLCFMTAVLTGSWRSEAQTKNVYEIVAKGLAVYVESKWEYNAASDIRELNYYNSDYCNYLLAREGDKTYNLRPGKNTIFSYKTGNENPFKTSGRYAYWRGAFVRDFNIETPYALPVRKGIVVQWVPDERQSQKTLKFMMEPHDTVYASRGGIVANSNDDRSVLMVHDDNTMALYISMHKTFVVPGENVSVGQPVGIADHGGQGVTWFFLDRNRFSSGVANGYPYSHFIPFFSTSEGLVQTEPGEEYEAVLSDEVVTLDMSKSARKKYLKNRK